jgi:hypothetical protein
MLNHDKPRKNVIGAHLYAKKGFVILEDSRADITGCLNLGADRPIWGVSMIQPGATTHWSRFEAVKMDAKKTMQQNEKMFLSNKKGHNQPKIRDQPTRIVI